MERFYYLPIILLGFACKVNLPKQDLMTFYTSSGEMKQVETISDWEMKRMQILDSMQAVMGPLPSLTDLPPLNVQYIDSIKESKYTRYSISFTAAPGESVSAYLYIPNNLSIKKYPAMLALHPTGPPGKRIIDEGGIYGRAYAKELAQRGYVVIAPDYPGYGDLNDYDFRNSRYVSGTMAGIFYHIRCVDLLQERCDVDEDRIGVIGHSLGGHNAMFVAAFEPRLKVIVSSAGWTDLEYYDIGPEADSLFGGRLGPWAQDRYMPLFRDKYHLNGDMIPFNFHEIIALLAPRPFFSNSTVNDFFDVNGVKEGIAKSGKAYHFLNADEQLQVRYPDGKHDFPDNIRIEAYDFIDKVFVYNQ